jgi:hypothetical protein
MGIYTNLKLVFIHIPKNAGTSVVAYLNSKDKDEPLLVCDTNVFTSIDNDYHIAHYTYLEILKCNIIPNYTGYTFLAIIRNPYYKILSVLCYNGVIDCNTSIEDLKEILKILFNKLDFVVLQRKLCKCKHVNFYSFSFDNKIKYVEIKHLLPQSEFLKNKDSEIEKSIKILRFEDLSNNFVKELNMCDFNIHENKSTVLLDYEAYLDPSVKQMIYDYYYEDFINFGYSF